MTHSTSDFEQMFDLAPVSLWLEDYSGIKRLFDHWRAQGVTDLASHLAADRERVTQCAQAVRIVRVNRHTLSLFKASSLKELQDRLAEVFSDDMQARFISELCQLWDGQREFSNQTFNHTLDGQRLEVRVRARILDGHETTWDRVLLTLEDVTQQEAANHALAERERYARNLFELSPVSLWVEDFSAIKRLLDELRHMGIVDFATFVQVHPDFVTRCMHEIRVIDVNQHTLRMFAPTDKQHLLRNISQVFRHEMLASFQEQLIDLWHGKTFQQREVVNHSLNGSQLHIHMQFHVMPGHEADWSMVLVSLVDITARKKAEAYLEYLGKHDVLTKLRNRAFYAEELNRLSRKGPWPVSVLAIDLNGLKEVNDEQGHAAGDALLRRAGEVLSKAVDSPACAARIGGDEFVVLLPATDEQGAQALRERLLSVLDMNNQFYPGHPLNFAIGSATCQAGGSLEAAVQAADNGMYQAKAAYYRDQGAGGRAGD